MDQFSGERPFSQITYIPEVALDRQADFEKINPEAITQFSPDVMAVLSSTQSLENKLEQLQSQGNKETITEQLIFILRNADMADLYAHEKQNPELNDTYLLKVAQQWKQERKNYLTANQNEIPTQIKTLADQGNYRLALTPPRYEDLDHGFIEPTSFETLRSAAQASLELSQDNPKLRHQVLIAIDETIKAQEKWWIFAAEGPRSPIEPLTSHLFATLVKFAPTESTDIILDSYFRKSQQDSIIVESLLNGTIESAIGLEIRLDPVINYYFAWAHQADKERLKDYLGMKMKSKNQDLIMTDNLMIKKQLHDTHLSLSADREIHYFGHQLKLDGLPPQATQIYVPTFGIAIAQDTDGNPLETYYIDPRSFKSDESVHQVTPANPTEILFTNTQIDPKQWQEFLLALPEITAKTSNLIGDRLSPASVSLRNYYDLWQHIKAHPQLETEMYDFIKIHGMSGISVFLNGPQENISRIIEFSKINPDIADALMPEYAMLAIDSLTFAFDIKPDLHEAAALHDMLLQRSKALLMAAVSISEKRGQLSITELKYLAMAIQEQRFFLNACANPDKTIAKRSRIPYAVIEELFTYADVNPYVQLAFSAIMESWLETEMRNQQTAEYANRADELNAYFYTNYREMVKDADKTTGDTELELARYKNLFNRDLDTLREKADKGEEITIGFVGIGNGKRIEAPLIEHMKQVLPSAKFRFVGVDQIDHADRIQDIEFRQMNMAELGDKMPDTFDQLYMIWSPLMDVLELKMFIKSIKSISTSLKADGKVIIDVHLPYGKHSYVGQGLIESYQETHPNDAPHMLENFYPQQDGTLLPKHLAAYDIPQILWAASQYGLAPVNLPISDSHGESIAGYIDMLKKDDDLVVKPNDTASAAWRTGSGMNRITYVFEKHPYKTPLIQAVAAD
ncbi:MAG: hypothetical protein ACEQSA_02600 [Weeksellaceae bacterium]